MGTSPDVFPTTKLPVLATILGTRYRVYQVLGSWGLTYIDLTVLSSIGRPFKRETGEYGEMSEYY